MFKYSSMIAIGITLIGCSAGSSGQSSEEFVSLAFACQDELGYQGNQISVETVFEGGVTTRAVSASGGLTEAQATEINACIARSTVTAS
ncbi:hypothetical protein BC777_3407 [Yoonia maricola]|uniref:Lipoprotein n=1 Tax=Yoonia maricola TaxID=420999 RepID=A0A2M8W3A3_9RHOB|nr:hypothetical protein [Yoonia maricola]PJI85405.1 hypothetical protein BC777_3407 [Yoonia maricola]